MEATFLFTDIEGSTRLLDRFGDVWPDLLAAHHAIIRETASAEGGDEIGSAGDAFYFFFSDPSAALRTAIAAQQRLAQHDWPPGGEVRVRMGVHTGAARRTAAGLVGLGLHEVARICSAAHGGQILISEAAMRCVADDNDVGFLDLGVHQLKDLARQRLYQVTVDGLRQSFPPPRALSARIHNLPASLTSFVGREREREEIADLLARHRLVSLVGPGGVGKSRIALQIAADALARYRDGAWLVELAPLRDPALVPEAVARVLGVSIEREADPFDAISAWASSRSLLVILDNCEHVLDGAAAAAQRLATAGESIAVLATSQVRLDVLGERRYTLGPLTLEEPTVEGAMPPAWQLFFERAALVEPDLSIDAVAVRSVSRICKTVEGLPLGIELAAAWADTLGLATIADRIEDRYDLLTRGNRAALERHRSLRALVTWSYELLDERERAALRRLAVLAGDFDEGTAAAVIGVDVDASKALPALVERSLVHVVTRGDRSRFRLAETIRQFASAVIGDASEHREAVARLVTHMISPAEKVREPVIGSAESDMMRALERDLPNIRLALEWALRNEPARGFALAVALQFFWEFKGLAREGTSWLARFLEADPDVAEEMRIEAQLGIALLAGRHGDVSTAEKWYVRAADAARANGLEAMRLRAVTGLASQFMYRGDYAGAVPILERALDDARTAEVLPRIARISNNLAIAKAQLGDIEGALVLAREAREINRTTGDATTAANSLTTIGWLLGLAGDHAGALEAIRSSLSTLTALGDRSPHTLAAIEDIGRMLVRSGRPRAGAVLMSFVTRMRGELDLSTTPDMDLAVAEGDARAALGDDGWAEAEEEARLLEMDEAIALALKE